MLIILIIIAVLWFLIFTKIFVFWVWFWQLKEYHWGRFKAHFKTHLLRKVFFSLHGIRYPKLTKKVIAILFCGIILEIAFLILVFNSPYYLFYLLISLLLAGDIASIIVLLFQIPTKIYVKLKLNRAKKKIKKFRNLTVIGITGSYGKTSAKEFLAEILSVKYKVLKTQKHINAEIGIAKTILNDLKEDHDILIAEIGAYERGKIKQVCKMIKPKIGILTGINDQHLATFGSQENIVKAKFELIDSLPKDGLAIFNWDSDLTRKEVVAKKLNINYKKCSVQGVTDFFARNIEAYRDYLAFKLYERSGESCQIQVNLLGRQNAINIVLAAAAAKKLGMNLDEISRACFNIKAQQGGIMYLRKTPPITIDATYSSNLDGVLADLEYLKTHKGSKIIIMPCLIELNGNSAADHERIAEKIAEVCDMAILTSKECLGPIKKNFPKAVYFDNPEKIAQKAREFDVIFLEGRLSPKIINYLK